MIPGGKWKFIDKAKNDWLPKQLAESGVAALAIDYRPSTTAPFPAALEDAQAAVRFVRAHADRFRYRSDSSRSGRRIIGGPPRSSARHVGRGVHDVGRSRSRSPISWSGPMDLRPLLHSSDGELVSVVETFLGCSAPADVRPTGRLASPITHVDPTDGAVYLANSTDEIIPASQAQQMAATLEHFDVPHELSLMPPEAHGLSTAAS